jgi:hypothetical protein
MRMLDPMLVFQTFETTTLTDVSKKRKHFNVIETLLKKSNTFQTFLDWFTVDPLTHQPVFFFLK